MFRPFLLAALALASVAAAVTPQTVKAEWTVPQTYFLGFTDTGDLVTQGRNTAALNVLDAATGQSKSVVVFPEVTSGRDLSQVAFTPDLNSIAWVNALGDTLTVRTTSGEWQKTMNGISGTRGLQFSPDGRMLALLNQNSYVQLWDVVTRQRKFTLRTTDFAPRNAAFNAAGDLLAVWDTGSRVTLWNTKTAQQIGADIPQVNKNLLAFLPDGRLLTTAGYSASLSSVPSSDPEVLSFPTYIEDCTKGSPFARCARGVVGGSFGKNGELIALNIRRTPQDAISSLLLYSRAAQLLKILDFPDGYAPTLTPDAQRLIWSSNQGDLMGAKVP